MSAAERLLALRRAPLQRRLAILAAITLPPLLGIAALSARLASPVAALGVLVVGLVLLAALGHRTHRGSNAEWLARRLDALDPRMEDSSALLFADAATLSPMQRLQRERLRQRLDETCPDLRPAWPRKRIGGACAIALPLLAVAFWHSPIAMLTDSAARHGDGAIRASTRLRQTQLDIAPPAYTQQPPRSESALDAKAAEGARLTWRLRFDPLPAAAALVFHDGRRVELERSGSDWRAQWTLAESTLYRIALQGAPALDDDRLHRLDAIADRAPELQVSAPDKTLTLAEPGQRAWTIAFEAEDDYDLRSAQLQLTLAQGSGENVAFKDTKIDLQGEPVDGTRRQRYRHDIDLAALGLGEGDDLIVRAVVHDNREPAANETRSAAFILRWPVPAAGDSGALEGVVQKTLPAYFRSQRQIIIDSEALLVERDALDEHAFLQRSDAIGVDQKILRLRYGQFLGEESEPRAHAERGSDTHDAPADGDDDHEHAHDGHDHGGSQEPTAAPAHFGEAGDVVAEYGHVHDIAEAATLLDPETRAILKSALAEMWQAELHLRQGDPAQALPYERRALDFVKQVQQSTRIYLARVGLELPQPDEARRLGGDRSGVTDRQASLTASEPDAQALARLWSALSGPAMPAASIDEAGATDWDAAEAWLRANASRMPDALGVLAAIDRARREPDCDDCRTALRDLLWPLLPTPAAGVASRPEPDAAGRAWLDATQTEARR